eukprot:352421-Chlamydomonas_euryale.AAC.34
MAWQRRCARAGQRRCGRAGQRRCARAGQRRCARAGQRRCGPAGQRRCARAGQRRCARAGQRRCGRAGQRRCGRAGQRRCARAGQRRCARGCAPAEPRVHNPPIPPHTLPGAGGATHPQVHSRALAFLPLSHAAGAASTHPEVDDLGDVAQRPQRRCVQVVADADDWARERRQRAPTTDLAAPAARLPRVIHVPTATAAAAAAAAPRAAVRPRVDDAEQRCDGRHALRSARRAVHLVDDDAVGAAVAEHALHLHRVVDALRQVGGRAVV